MSRIDEIMTMIEEYSTDSMTDGYEHGYDEGYEEAKASAQDLIDEAYTEGYDEGYDTGQSNLEAEEFVEESNKKAFIRGYNEALNDFSYYLKPMRSLVHTPETGQELERAVDMFKDNGVMLQTLTYNYLHHKLEIMLGKNKDES